MITPFTRGLKGRPGLRYTRKVIDPAVEAEIAAGRASDDLARAATAAVRGYGPQILGYLRSTLGHERADDAFSMFCESLWKGLGKFRGESSFLTWAYQLAWGAAQRIITNPHRRRAVRLSSSTMASLVQEIRSTPPVYLRTEESRRLDRIREALEPAEQTLLVLRVDRALPWEDIAQIMASDAAALRKRFERLKLKIKRIADDDRRAHS